MKLPDSELENSARASGAAPCSDSDVQTLPPHSHEGNKHAVTLGFPICLQHLKLCGYGTLSESQLPDLLREKIPYGNLPVLLRGLNKVLCV